MVYETRNSNDELNKQPEIDKADNRKLQQKYNTKKAQEIQTVLTKMAEERNTRGKLQKHITNRKMATKDKEQITTSINKENTVVNTENKGMKFEILKKIEMFREMRNMKDKLKKIRKANNIFSYT